MKLEDLLKIQFEIDTLKDLYNLYDSSLGISFDQYKKLCQSKIKREIKDLKFLDKEKKCKYLSENRCCARIWDNHYGTRCRYKRIKDKEYCNHHNNMIIRSGKLLFNRYDEAKPIINEKGNRIPWFTNSNIETLNDLVQEQHEKLIGLIDE
jgi:hypothetical protein